MKKLLLKWQTILLLSVISLFSLLFFVLYQSLMEMPNSGYSRSIEIGSYEIGTDIRAFNKANFAYSLSDDCIYLIYSDQNAMNVSSYDFKGALIESNRFESYRDYSQLTSSYLNGTLLIAGFNDHSKTIDKLSYDISKKNISLVDSSDQLDTEMFAITTHGYAYAADDAIIVTVDNQTHKINAPHIKRIDLFEDNEQLSLLYSNYNENSYQLHLHSFDLKLKPRFAASPFYTFGSGNAFVPTEFNMMINGNLIDLIAVIKDTKSGINNVYWFKTDLKTPDTYSFKNFPHYGYSVFPKLYKTSDGIRLALSSNTAVGKVEIGSSKSLFQNIVSVDYNAINDAKSITRSTQASINPKLFSIDSHQYALYSRVNNGNVKLFLSSTHPDLIHTSRQIQLNEFINLLMTTMTTFLPLSYMALILEVYILTPVLFIIVFISMFKMTWSERNGNTLLFLSLSIHIFAKFFFIFTRIVQVPEVINNFPLFLNTPIKTFGFGLFFTALTCICFFDYVKKNPNNHYLKNYIFFNLIDMLLFIMLYTPYYLI